MKSFLKMTLAVILGLIIVTIISTVITFGIIGAAASAGKSTPQVSKNSVLKIDLSKTLVSEQTVEVNPFENLQNTKNLRIIGIWDAVQAINNAAGDPFISCIYLKSDGNLNSLASLQELRKALSNFKAGGKPIISYIESPGTGSYYIASVADKVYMASYPGATTTVLGLGSQMIFIKDLLDKLGVNVQLIRHGKYKSAGEMFVRNSPSEENLEQYQTMINSMWDIASSEIAASREISTAELNSCIDELKLCLPEDFLNCKLVDELLSREELKDKLTTFAMAEDFKDVNFINLAEYYDARIASVPSKAHNKIAVIYANGEIVDGADNKEVAGDRFASVIAEVRADSTVKAVVLRVNSPGGSVLASDKIRTELDLLKQDKPLIASYGDYAASGGYWISANCDKIYSNGVTLTGSIGVFGMIPDFSKTLKNVAHVNVASVTSNKHGDMFSLMRPFDQAEYNYMQRSIEDIYVRFTTIVSEARDLDLEYVDSIGQGRVWTGADGLEKGLVDELGTLEDAIHYAAVCAGDPELGNWKVCGYPKPRTQIEMILEMLGEKKSGEDNIFAGTSLEKASATFCKWAETARKGNADLTFARLPYDVEIR